MSDILFLTQRIPYPPDKGDKIRAYHILRHLAERFRIHLGCFCDDPDDFGHVAHLENLCTSMLCLPLNRPMATLRGLRGLALGKSLSEFYFRDTRMTRWVASTMSTVRPETVFVFCSAMAPYAMPFSSECRVVLDMVDVDSEKFRAYGQSAWWPLSTLYAKEQSALLTLERRAALAFDRSFLVSREEAQTFLALAPDADGRVGHFSNGVDLSYFDPTKEFLNPFQARTLPVVFTGTMSYKPNIDAVEWFAAKVLPLIRNVSPRAEFWIVGADPVGSVRKLARRGFVHVTGKVADVRPYLAHAACVVAPLHLARGVQNKMLEAFAMAKPVVATRDACEGIQLTPGKHTLVAEEPSDFAHAVSLALSGRCIDLGRDARLLVETNHSWSRNLAVLDQVLMSDVQRTEARVHLRDVRSAMGAAS